MGHKLLRFSLVVAEGLGLLRYQTICLDLQGLAASSRTPTSKEQNIENVTFTRVKQLKNEIQ